MHQSRHKRLTLVMKSKPSWPNAAAPSVGLLRTAAVSVHSLPSAPTVQNLIIICSHLLQLSSQTLSEFTDSVTISFLCVSIDCVVLLHNYHLVPVIPALTLEVSSYTAEELPALQPSPCWKRENCCGEPGTYCWCIIEFISKSSAVSRLFEVLKDSEEDLTHDDETGPEHCTAQSRDQMHLPSKGA